ncbi:MAG: hypothetical protein ACTSVZ_06605 [Promethearchaeota archaeon]
MMLDELGKKHILDKEYKDFEFEKKDHKDNRISSRGSVRFSLGKCYSNKEWKKRKKAVLKMRIP